MISLLRLLEERGFNPQVEDTARGICDATAELLADMADGRVQRPVYLRGAQSLRPDIV